MNPGFITNPIRPLQGATPLGPMQGVGDPRLGAPVIPGNRAQMMMRGPQQAPMQQFSYGGRAGYQIGGMGIGSLPMDYGQSLQVPSMSNPSFSPMQSMPSSPMLNYGQPQLGQAGGTPLTMRNGGMSRSGYQEGGMGMEMMQPQMQEQAMMQDQAMMQPQMQQAPQIDPSQIDPRRALELIIQMLIDQGIPPDQAREIAIQMVQAVAEGGMGEMSDERVEARFGGRIGYASGGIGSLVDREGYFLGSVFKGIGKVFKGVTKAVKSIVKSDLGKLALAAAAIYAGGGGFGFSPGGFSMFGTSAGPGLLGSSGAFDLGSSVIGQGLFGTPGTLMPGDVISGGSKGFLGNLGITSGFGTDLIPAGIKSLLPSTGSLVSGTLGGVLGGVLGGAPKREDYGSDEEYQQAVDKYKLQFQTAINNPNPQFGSGQFPNNPFYPQREVKALAANGGRIGYQEGGIGDLIKQITQQEFFGTPMMANGGRMGYAMGAEVPTRQNEAGITELDYREKGGFVPPIGIKEKADDIPAMLSNNEFVFTADAVRNAGNGSVNKGAERMYGLMKKLEAGGIV
jgi:hypothetical protein